MGNLITKGSIGALQIQPDWTIEDDGFGLLTSRVTFVGDATAASSRPKKLDAHPEDNRLQCHKSAVTITAGKKCVVVADYVGLSSGARTDLQWSFDAAGGTQPIQSHPYFSNKKSPKTNKYFTEMGWDFAKGRFDDVSASVYGLQGQRSYIAPEFSLGLVFYTTDKEGLKSLMESVGKISSTIKGADSLVIPGKYEPVSVYHTMPILITSAGYEMFAHLYKVRASARIATGNWNSIIYDPVP
jgi:hypothetical protein